MKLRLLVLFVFIGLTPLIASELPRNWTWDNDDETRAAHAELEGKPMPSLDVGKWVNGMVTPDDMKGKIVVIDFYATWCGPCIAAIPHNNEIMEKYKDKGVMILGICTSRRGQETMESQAKEKGIRYPIANDPELAAQEAWRVRYYPTYAIVDRQGIVRVVGLQPECIEKVIEQILSEDVLSD